MGEVTNTVGLDDTVLDQKLVKLMEMYFDKVHKYIL